MGALTYQYLMHSHLFFYFHLSSFTVEVLAYPGAFTLFTCHCSFSRHFFVFHPSWWKHWHISMHSHCLHVISFSLACLCLPSFTVEAWTYLLHSHMHSHYRYR